MDKTLIAQIRPGFLADLLLVDGDPLADIKLLQRQDALLVIMKDGRLHKGPGRLKTHRGSHAFQTCRNGWPGRP
jgi:hypothetical protein